MFKKLISIFLSFTLIFTQPLFAQGVAQLNLGSYLSTVGQSIATDRFRPLHMRYFSYDLKADNFQLLLDKGDNKDIKETELEEKTKVLMEYFQIGLALPNDKFWVNLRPDAQDEMIDPELEKTDMGKIMLEADLQLKRDTAQATSPQTPEGKAYWDKLYKKAGELFGTENITIPTITRPWIVPGEVILRQGEDSAYIFKANMKVLLEEDYLKSHQDTKSQSHQYNFNDPRMKELNEYSTQLIRELIIPKLTKEVNSSKRYASLRQVFFSLVMARWFKDTFKDKSGQYAKLIDSHNLNNLTSKQTWDKTYYFNEYKKSFEQGEYNLKENITTPTGQVIRSYVSGGIAGSSSAMVENKYRGSKERNEINEPIMTRRGFLIALAVAGVSAVGLVHLYSTKYGIPKEPIISKEVAGNQKFTGINQARKVAVSKLRSYSYQIRTVPGGEKWIKDKGWILEHLAYVLDMYVNFSYNLELFASVLMDKALTNDLLHVNGNEEILNILKAIGDNLNNVRIRIVDMEKQLSAEEKERVFLELVDFIPPSILPDDYGKVLKRTLESPSMWDAFNPKPDAKEYYNMLIVSLLHLLEQNNSKKTYDVLIRYLKGYISSSPAQSVEQIKKASSLMDAAINNKTAPENAGGIDFRAMNYLVQPMGGFKDLQFSLPTLSSSALERINLDEELGKLRDMVKNGMVPSGARFKEYLAACFQKGKIEEKQDDLLVCLAEIYRLAEEENLETSPELRESLVIVDTGKFVLLPNNQRVGLN